MKKQRNVLWIALGLFLAIGGAAAGYLFFKPHRTIRDSKLVQVAADSLYRSFLQDEAAANRQYLDKGLEIQGKVASVQTNQQGQTVIVFETGDPMGGIACTLKNPPADIKPGQISVVRGFCSGYLTDVVIRDAEIVP